MKKRIIIIYSIGLILLIGFILLLKNEVFKYLLFNGQTQYPSKYSEKNFNKIHLGMAKKEVYLLVGLPLKVEVLAYCDKWEYYSQNKENQKVYDIFGSFTEIYFDPKGTVSGFRGELLEGISNGLTKSEIRTQYGLPSKTVQIDSGYKMIYSQPINSGTYKIRNVYLNDKNIVVKIEKDIYYD